MRFSQLWNEADHPRDRLGRFRSKWKMGAKAKGVVDGILDRFQPRSFPDHQRANQYGMQRGWSRYKPSQKKALTDYVRGNWKTTNASLRQGQVTPEATEIDQAMHPLEDDLILTRSLGPEAFGVAPDDIQAVEELTGKLIQDKAYTSAWMGAPTRNGGISVHILAPRGTPAVFPGGAEVMLSRDQPYRITRAEEDGAGGMRLYAVAVPPSGAQATRDLPGAVQAGRVAGNEQAETPDQVEAVPDVVQPAAAPAATPETPAAAPQAAPTPAAPAAPQASAANLGDTPSGVEADGRPSWTSGNEPIEIGPAIEGGGGLKVTAGGHTLIQDAADLEVLAVEADRANLPEVAKWARANQKRVPASQAPASAQRAAQRALLARQEGAAGQAPAAEAAPNAPTPAETPASPSPAPSAAAPSPTPASRPASAPSASEPTPAAPDASPAPTAPESSTPSASDTAAPAAPGSPPSTVPPSPEATPEAPAPVALPEPSSRPMVDGVDITKPLPADATPELRSAYAEAVRNAGEDQARQQVTDAARQQANEVGTPVELPTSTPATRARRLAAVKKAAAPAVEKATADATPAEKAAAAKKVAKKAAAAPEASVAEIGPDNTIQVTPEGADAIRKITVAQLREQATAAGIEVPKSARTKAAILDAIVKSMATKRLGEIRGEQATADATPETPAVAKSVKKAAKKAVKSAEAPAAEAPAAETAPVKKAAKKAVKKVPLTEREMGEQDRAEAKLDAEQRKTWSDQIGEPPADMKPLYDIALDEAAGETRNKKISKVRMAAKLRAITEGYDDPGADYLRQVADLLTVRAPRKAGPRKAAAPKAGLPSVDDLRAIKNREERLQQMDRMSVTDLRKIATDTKLPGRSKLLKEALKNALADHLTTPDAPAPSATPVKKAVKAAKAAAPEVAPAKAVPAPAKKAAKAVSAPEVDNPIADGDRAAKRAAARQRQRDIEERVPVATAGAELQELINKKADNATIAQHIRAQISDQALEAVAPERRSDVLRGLDHAASAFERDNPGLGKRLMTSALKKAGVTLDGQAGKKVDFDPKTMEPVGSSVPDGTPVEVIRPGATYGDTVLSKAQVSPVIATPAKKAAKKAVKAVAPEATPEAPAADVTPEDVLPAPAARAVKAIQRVDPDPTKSRSMTELLERKDTDGVALGDKVGVMAWIRHSEQDRRRMLQAASPEERSTIRSMLERVAAGGSEAVATKIAKDALKSDFPSGSAAKAATPAARAPLSTDPETRAMEIRNRVREAYGSLARRDGDWIKLADLREKIGDDVPRMEVDRQLTLLNRTPDINITPEDNESAMTSRDRNAAVVIGNESKHAISISRNQMETAPTPAKKAAAPATPTVAREAEIESRIRQAYQGRSGSNEMMSLADLRDSLADVPRDEQDAALKRLITQPGVQIIPESNQSALTPRLRAASARIGGQDKHHILFSGAAAKKAAPAKAAAKATPAKAVPTKADLDAGTSRDAVRAQIEGLSNDQLREILKDPGFTAPPVRGTKKQMQDFIVQWTVGRRLDSDAVSGVNNPGRDIDSYNRQRAAAAKKAAPAAPTPEVSPAASPAGNRTRTELMAMSPSELLEIENEMGLKRPSLDRGARVSQILRAQAFPQEETETPTTPAKKASPSKATPEPAKKAAPAKAAPKETTGVTGKMSTKPRLNNSWGDIGRSTNDGREDLHYHDDGAVGQALLRLGRDADLEIDGDSLFNVIGRIRTDAQMGKITTQQMLDRIKAVALRLPRGNARSELARAIADIDTPKRPLPDLPASLPNPLKDLARKLFDIPLARDDKTKPAETSMLAGLIGDWREGNTSYMRIIRRLHEMDNRRHESFEGKSEIDQLLRDTEKKLKAMYDNQATRHLLKPPAPM